MTLATTFTTMFASTLASWLNDLDPVIVQITGGLAVRWYGLAYILGFFAAYLLLRLLVRRGATPIPPARAADVIITAALGAVIGGRLGYILLYQPSLLVEFTSSFPFWGALAIHKGGMASHGGMVGVVAAAVIMSRGFKTPGGGREGASHPLHLLDRLALITPPGLFFGRLANFVNGELLGKIAARAGDPAPAWSVRFPTEVLEHPGDISPAQWVRLEHLTGEHALDESGHLTEAFETTYRSLLSGLREGTVGHDAFANLINARHPSQLYQAMAEGVVLGLALWFIARRPRRAGVVSAWFLIVYGAGRVTTEFWRLPDAHLAVQRFAGLSRGQWLSVVMVLAGAALLLVIARRKTPVFPGWRRVAA